LIVLTNSNAISVRCKDIECPSSMALRILSLSGFLRSFSFFNWWASSRMVERKRSFRKWGNCSDSLA